MHVIIKILYFNFVIDVVICNKVSACVRLETSFLFADNDEADCMNIEYFYQDPGKHDGATVATSITSK